MGEDNAEWIEAMGWKGRPSPPGTPVSEYGILERDKFGAPVQLIALGKTWPTREQADEYLEYLMKVRREMAAESPNRRVSLADRRESVFQVVHREVTPWQIVGDPVTL